MNEPLPLEIEELTVLLRGRAVLQSVSFKVFPGDFVAVIGPNGGGKTVLLKTILGLIPPAQGRIAVFGLEPREARGLVGYVPQFANFDTSFPITVEQVVLSGALGRSGRRWRIGYSKEEIALAERTLDRLRLTELRSRNIGKISGGQLQRVLIARALMLQPKLLLLDEPTASLDTPIGQSVYQLLEELSAQMSIVLVSHDIGVLSRHAKTIACLNRKLHYHHSKELTSQMLEEAYGCPVDLIAHGHAHRVLDDHGHS